MYLSVFDQGDYSQGDGDPHLLKALTAAIQQPVGDEPNNSDTP